MNKMEWAIGKQCFISKWTPWDILRSSLLSFLSCQKCEYDLREGHFHLGILILANHSVGKDGCMEITT
jgi:hypothetical protein